MESGIQCERKQGQTEVKVLKVYFMQNYWNRGRDLSTEFHSAYNRSQWGLTAKEQGEGVCGLKYLKETSQIRGFLAKRFMELLRKADQDGKVLRMGGVGVEGGI